MNLSESQHRLYEKLYRDLGENIIDSLLDKHVNEIMLNPDGKLWIDSATDGFMHKSDLSKAQAFSIINSIAGIHNFIVNQHSPRLEAELPLFKAMKGERFTAQIPPIVSSPSFSIRKKAEKIFSLEDYVDTKRLSLKQKNVLIDLIKSRKSILVSGGPGSGKTTFTNALIKLATQMNPQMRFLILEDLPELQCSAPNTVAMLTSDQVNMRALLRTAMRMRPDAILVGEVRGGEALDMLKAWNTGCPGGICTIHANGAEEAVQRILDLAMEAGLKNPPIQLVLHTIDAIVSVTRQETQKGFVEEILKVEEYKNEKFLFKKLA